MGDLVTDQLELGFVLEARDAGHRIPLPRARVTDPSTSHMAAEEMAPGADDLGRAIRAYLWTHGPSTAWEVADAIAGDRWEKSTVRSGCAPARSGCIELDGGKRIVRGKERAVKLYAVTEKIASLRAVGEQTPQ